MKSLQILWSTVASFLMFYSLSIVAMPVIESDDLNEAPSVAPTTLLQPTSPQQTSIKKNGPTDSLVESFSSDGPNTVDQPEEKIGTNGNWCKKKDFLMRSFDVQQEIEAIATKIQSYRSVYQQKFNSIDGELESFYKQLGLEQGKVEGLLTSLGEYIDQKKQRRINRFKQNITDIREQQFAIEQLEESLKANKEELAQLKIDMKAIEELDKSVNARIQRAEEQITVAQREAARTKEIIQSIWDMLDDRRAKAAYFELKDGILRRLQSINNYLQQELLSDLEKLGSTINTQLKKTRDAIKNLEDKGFLIRDRNKRLDDLNIKKAKEAAAELIALQHKENKPSRTVKKTGYFNRLYNNFVDWLANVYRFFTSIFSKSTSNTKVRVPAVATISNEQKSTQAPTTAAPTQQQAQPPTQSSSAHQSTEIPVKR